MFKKPFFLACSFLCIFAAIIFYNLIDIKQKDFEEFYSLANEKNKNLESKKLSQERNEVRKYFWIEKEGESDFLKIESEDSNLELIGKRKKWAVKETLNHLSGNFFERNKNYQLEEVTFFQSNSGSYVYPEHQFNCDDTTFTMQSFQHAFNPISRFSIGKAKRFSFSPQKENAALTANHVEVSTSLSL